MVGGDGVDPLVQMKAWGFLSPETEAAFRGCSGAEDPRQDYEGRITYPTKIMTQAEAQIGEYADGQVVSFCTGVRDKRYRIEVK